MTRFEIPVPVKMRAFLRGKARAKATEARQAKAEEIAATLPLSGQNCPVQTSDCTQVIASKRCQ